MGRNWLLLVTLFIVFILNTAMLFVARGVFPSHIGFIEITFFAIFVLNGLTAVVLSYLIYGRYNRKLVRRILETIGNIEEGNLTDRVSYQKDDDHLLKLVAHGVNRMAASLENRTRQLQNMALFDELTHLHNRHFFMNRAAVELAMAKSYHYPLSLIMIDIDFFKKINDKYGHLVGDVVLQDIAKVLNDTVRATDILARYGGEEFILLLPKANLETALILGSRILTEVPLCNFNFPPNPFNVTVSLGVAELHDQIATLDQLIKQADDALYRAKESGRNRLVH